ncbi:MAG TPA: ADOP family duplicated permease [bacterium]|nr:ADOP family duplicated permease [bacterium]
MSRYRELHTAWRNLRRSPAFSITTILVLGLGIGATTAMVTLVRTLLLRPLPVTAQDRIVVPRVVDARGTDMALTVEEVEGLRRDSRTLAQISGEAHQGAFTTTLLDGDQPLSLAAAWVSGNFFDLLGARPVLGRFFHANEESRIEPAVAVITYRTWQTRFAGDSGVLGHKLRSPYTGHTLAIVGVAPPGLDYPRGVEYWSPLVYGGGLNVVGRLAPGVTPLAARAEFDALTKQIFARRPANTPQVTTARIRTLPEAIVGDVRPVLLALTGAVALLLGISGMNVGTLLLLRLTQREREIAIRCSLGARTADIVRQLVTESGLLALGGGAAGWALSRILLALAATVALPGLPRLDRLPTSAPFAAATVTLLVMLLAASLPTWITIRTDLATPLRADHRAGGGARSRRRMRQWFVAAQAGIALVLLAGAGLVARSLERLEHLDLGYRADHLSILTVAAPVGTGGADSTFAAVLERVTPALRALPGVTALTSIEAGPFYGPQIFTGRWQVEGRSADQSGGDPFLPIEAGGPDYFRTFQIPLLRGRGFLATDRQRSLRVAVVSEGAARILGLGDSALGRRIRLAGDTAAQAWWTVVGLARDVHYRLLRTASPAVILPSSQFFFQGEYAVRTSGPLANALPALQRLTRDAYPGAALVQAEPMDELLAKETSVPRVSTLVLGGFGASALLLAGLGLFGVVATTVRERTSEFGIRAALGATPGQIRGSVVRQALVVAGLGIAGGLGVALLASRFLAALLFEVSPLDPLTLLGAAAVLLLVAVTAAVFPAQRATRIDPIRALRAE